MPFSASLLSLIKERENEKAKLLIQQSDLLKEVDEDGATLLHHAAEHGNLELTEYLLDKGCSIDAQNAGTQTPLVKSLEGRHHAVARLLLDRGADDRNTIHEAVLSGDARSVRLLLKRGVDVDAIDRRDVTPLAYLYHRADKERERERIEILTMFLEAGASLTKLVLEGFLTIQLTLAKGSCEAVRLVLRSNVDFGARCEFGNKTLLHLLAMNRDPGIVEEVRPYIERFDVDAVDKWGGTPLHEAIARGNVRMTEFLLVRGVKTGLFNSRHRLATLLCAFAHSSPGTQAEYNECVELLFQHGEDAQATMTSEFGEEFTVLDAALIYDRPDRLKSAIGQIAIREKQGVPVTQLISSQLEEYPKSKVYLKRCRRLLNKRVAGTVTIFKLLTANEKKMANYLKSERLVVKLIRMSHNPKITSSYSFYYNTVRKRFAKGILYNALAEKAAIVITKLLEYRVDKSNIVVASIIEYLNNEDLRILYVM